MPARSILEGPALGSTPVESHPRKSRSVGRRPARPSRSPLSDESSEDIPTTPSLADLLAAIARRTHAHHDAEEVWTHSPPERPSRGFSVLGCLIRLVLFIIVLIVLVFGGWIVLLSG